MKEKKKIVFLTGTRADFGKIKSLILGFQKNTPTFPPFALGELGWRDPCFGHVFDDFLCIFYFTLPLDVQIGPLSDLPCTRASAGS